VEVFVARQPIFDRNRNVWAYELLFRSDGDATHFGGAEPSSATRQVISHGMLSIGWDKMLSGKHGSINFGRDMLLQDLYSSLPPGQTIIELTEDIEADQEVLEAVRGVREQGYRIALDDFRPSPRMDSLVDLADLVKIEMDTPKTEQEVLAAKVTAPYDAKVPGGLLPAGTGTSADRFVSMVYSQLKGGK